MVVKVAEKRFTACWCVKEREEEERESKLVEAFNIHLTVNIVQCQSNDHC